MCISEVQNVTRWLNKMKQRIVETIGLTGRPHRINVNLPTNKVDPIDSSVASVLWTTIRVTGNYTAAGW